MSGPDIIQIKVLAERLEISEGTLRDWMASNAALKSCIVHQTKRSTWLSVQRLIDHGFLLKNSVYEGVAS